MTTPAPDRIDVQAVLRDMGFAIQGTRRQEQRRQGSAVIQNASVIIEGWRRSLAQCVADLAAEPTVHAAEYKAAMVTAFQALCRISLCTDLGGEVDGYGTVADAVERMHAERYLLAPLPAGDGRQIEIRINERGTFLTVNDDEDRLLADAEKVESPDDLMERLEGWRGEEPKCPSNGARSS